MAKVNIHQAHERFFHRKVIMLNAILNRVSRDMTEGVLAIDKNGEILYMNQTARILLAIPDIHEGNKFMDVFHNELQEKNDDFLQCVLDAVYNKQKINHNRVNYVDHNGQKRCFSVTSSFLYDEDGKTREGVVLCISDITAEVLNEKKAGDSAKMFVLIVASICLWVTIYSALVWFKIPFHTGVLTQIEQAVAVIISICIIRHTSLTLEDIGLSLKLKPKYLILDTILTVAALLILILGKLVIGYEGPFWHFDRLDFTDIYYPLTVIFQEVLTRSIIHESVARIMSIRHGKWIALIVTSLCFGALHIHMGLPYMVGAMALMAIFGLIYDKQKSIWGLCIPHYVLGTAMTVVFGF